MALGLAAVSQSLVFATSVLIPSLTKGPREGNTRPRNTPMLRGENKKKRNEKKKTSTRKIKRKEKENVNRPLRQFPLKKRSKKTKKHEFGIGQKSSRNVFMS